MKRPRSIVMMLLAIAAAAACFPGRESAMVRLKIENDGRIFAGSAPTAAGAPADDPYFVPENNVARVSIPVANPPLMTGGLPKIPFDSFPLQYQSIRIR